MTLSDLGALALFVAAAAGVGQMQPRLARTVRSVKETVEVYAFPPPAELHAMTLGWDAAVVDLLWAKLLVDYGVHWSEHRDFRDVPNYADAILELEPNYAPLYHYIDTMLAYRPLRGTEADVRHARAYLERATRERSQDANAWLQYGQFIAFIAPSFLQDEGERAAWRRDGATAMGHAVELGSDAGRAIAAASMLTRAGEVKAAVRYLARAYELTADSSMQEVHDRIGRQLVALNDTAAEQATDAAMREVNARWHREFPFLGRDRYLLLGPRVDPLRCAGPRSADDAACAHDWASALATPESPVSSADSP